MAISNNSNILSLLKVFYGKEGVENLLYRNSPLLKKIKKTRIEGKTYNFAALYSRGGACSADYTKAVDLASTVAKNVEFSVEPGQLFSAYGVTPKELLASKTLRGAYMPIAAEKAFASAESLRKTLAHSLYSDGYGTLATGVTATLTAGTPEKITLPTDAVMAIDVGSELVVRPEVNSSTIINTLTVEKIDSATEVTVTPKQSANIASTNFIQLAGMVGSDGSPLAPVGLGAWLPVDRDDLGTAFFGVKRDVAPNRLAGIKVTGAKNKDTIIDAIRQARQQGSLADLIVLNDKTWAKIASDLETTNSFFTKTQEGGKRKSFSAGANELSFNFSTSWVDNVIDDNFCPENVGYVLSSDTIEFVTYSNTENKVNDGIANNAPGKPEVTGDAGEAERPFQLLVDDLLTVVPGVATTDGAASIIAINLFGQFVVHNPSNCAVISFTD